jgi:FKBP-type peptidyl-prolyl cis-trans isomerase FkpA
MKKVSIGIVALVSLLSFSCSEKETPGGVKYTVLKQGDGEELPAGQFMVMNLSLRDAKDSVWFNTKETGYPAVIPVPDESMVKDDGEYGVFKILTKGDCVTFKLTAQTVFTKTRRRPVPKGVEPSSNFTFVTNLIDIWNQEQVQEFQKKIMVESQFKQMAIDSALIANHLKEKGLEAKSTPSGLRYILQKAGKGELVPSGKTAYVHYAGYTLNGKIFDTSLASVAKANDFDNRGLNSPYPVVVNTQSVIAGWDEILQLMNKGTKVTVYIPSHLGYGQQGNGPSIPPNTVLMFDMEVVDIK